MTEVSRNPIHTPAAWTAQGMTNSTAWEYHLSKVEIEEIEAAVISVKKRQLSMTRISCTDFILPKFGLVLKRLAREVEEGCGVMLLRGLPIARWGEADSLTAYWGLCVHLGEISGQNKMGQLLAHVRATGQDMSRDHTVRGHQTTSFLPFHCDHGDTVSLLCLQAAKSGGESCIASAVGIHNAVIERRPDLTDALYSPLYVDFRGQELPGMRPYYVAPLFTFYNGRLFSRTGRVYIESAQRFQEVPRLTHQQTEALSYVETLAQSDEFRLDMTFEQGDIQILNNHFIMHSRTEYEDYPEPNRWRHLARVLLLTSNEVELPESERFINNTTRRWRDHSSEKVAQESSSG